jgi:integrase
MVKLKIIVLKGNKRQDGSIPISAKITQNGERAYIRTPFYVFCNQLDRKGDIKDVDIRIAINLLYNKIAKILMDLGFSASRFSIKEIKNHIETILKYEDSKLTLLQSEKVDFFEFAEAYVEKMQNNDRRKSSINYETAVRNLAKFLGRDTNLDFNEMTSTFLKKYYEWMVQNKLGLRGQELYLVSIRAIFNEALSTYNDCDDSGKILIQTNPFQNFKMPTSGFISSAEKKALSANILQKIFIAPVSTPKEKLSRDVFLLSFCLCGINAKDLYTCNRIEGTQLIYHRSKTKNNSLINSEMRINIPVEALHLLEEYRAKTENSKYVFSFAEHYANSDRFTSAISRGLKKINETLNLNLPGLSLYYARHSWATIASNDVHLPDELVDECLVHTPVHRMLRSYVKRDWSKIDKANRQVLDFVFYGKTPPEGSVSI